MMNEFDLGGLLYTASVWVLPVLFAVTFHEASHGFIADMLGDDTARVFRRKPDAATGYHELAIEERDRRAPPKPATAEPERPKGS